MDSCVLGDGRTMRVGDVVWGGVDCTGFVDGSGDFEGRHAVTWWPGKVRLVFNYRVVEETLVHKYLIEHSDIKVHI